MFTKRQLENYAEVMLWGLKRGKGGTLRKNSYILVRFDLAGLALAEEICGLLHREGYVPVPSLMPTARMESDFYNHAGTRRLGLLPPGETELYKAISGTIVILAPESLTHLTNVDPQRLAIAQQARKPLAEITRSREAEHAYGWTICLMPTPELAVAAGASFDDYTREIIKACLLDEDDPMAAWKERAREVGEICKRLNSFGNVYLHVEGEGTDLSFRVGPARRWVGITGRNIPSFEIYISPDWRSVNGVYYADLPSFRTGTVVERVQLNFSQGSLVRLEADAGAPFAREQASIDPGAGRVGEFALVDKRFSRISRFMATTLYDENFGGEHGSMHLALGRSYSNTYTGEQAELTGRKAAQLGFNNSALHWDLISTQPRRVSAILPGGGTLKRHVPLYEDGVFVV